VMDGSMVDIAWEMNVELLHEQYKAPSSSSLTEA
jgi:hypothetical protein